MKKILQHLMIFAFALVATQVYSQPQQGGVKVISRVVKDTVIVHSSVYYHSDARLPKASEDYKVDELYQWLKGNSATVELVGYADITGTTRHNIRLALSRAEGIKDQLTKLGIDKIRIIARGEGVDLKVDDNAKARRVDVFTKGTLLHEVVESTKEVEVKVEVIKETPVEVVTQVIKEIPVEVEKEVEKVEYVEPERSAFSIGVDLGLPQAVSTLSSWGESTTHYGFSAGIFGRYTHSKLLSADLFINLSSIDMSNVDCPYWLSSQGDYYYSEVTVERGAYYSDIYSNVSMQQYGLRVNVNVFSLIKSLDDLGLSLNISPMAAITSSNAKLFDRSSYESIVYDPARQTHISWGGELSVGYNLMPNMNVELYSGYSALTGQGVDGLPYSGHDENKLFKSGVRISWKLLKKSNNE